MNKAVKTLFMIAVVALFGYTFYLLWHQAQPEPEVYKLVPVERHDVQEKVVATGYLEPRMQMELKPLVTGVVEQLNVKLGDYVHKGDVVAVISVIPDMQLLNQAKSEVKIAQLELQQIETDAKRSEELCASGAISVEQNEQQQKLLAQARERLAEAQNGVQIILKGNAAATGNVNTTLVVSKLSGYVLQLPVKVGSSVSGSSLFSEGTTIAKIGDINELIFKGTVDELAVSKLREGLPVNLTLGACKDAKLSGSIEFIAPEGIQKNGMRQFEIKSSVSCTDSLTLRSGYSANALVIVNEAKNCLAIEENCVRYEGEQAVVDVLTSDPADTKHQEFKSVPVSLGISNGVYVEVKDGIDEKTLLKGAKE